MVLIVDIFSSNIAGGKELLKTPPHPIPPNNFAEHGLSLASSLLQ